MTTYFTSKAPSRSGKRGNASISDLQIDLSTVDTSAELQKLPPKNVEAKKQLLAKHTADFHKWLLPLRLVHGTWLLCSWTPLTALPFIPCTDQRCCLGAADYGVLMVILTCAQGRLQPAVLWLWEQEGSSGELCQGVPHRRRSRSVQRLHAQHEHPGNPAQGGVSPESSQVPFRPPSMSVDSHAHVRP